MKRVLNGHATIETRALSGARARGSAMATRAAPDVANMRAPASLADERTPMLLAQARDTLEAYASASPGSFAAVASSGERSTVIEHDPRRSRAAKCSAVNTS